MKFLKICFVGLYDSFPSYAGENVRILQLTNALVELGLEIHILVPRLNSNFKNSSADNLCRAIIHDVNCESVPKYPYGYTLPLQLKYLVNLHKKVKFDLVHANMFWGGLFGLCIRRLLNIPTIFDPHDWFFCDLYNFPFYNSDFVEIYCAKKLEATIVTGHALRQYLSERCRCISQKLYIVPNGVNECLIETPVKGENVSKVRERLGIDDSDGVVVFLGALTYCQGVDVLIKAMKNIRSLAKLVVIGDGPEKQNLESLAKNLNLSNDVIFTGKIPWEILIQLLDASDVAVAPFRFNRYTAWIQPIKVFEYYAREKPVIGSNLPGVSEIVRHGINGLLVPCEDVEKLSASLSYLLKNKDVGKRMGQEGKKMVAQNFTWRKNAFKLKKVYENILSNEI